MKLKRLIYLTRELGDVLDKFIGIFEVIGFEDSQKLQECVLENGREWADSVLLAAATDKTIVLGKELGIAVFAYANTEIPNQVYRGVDILIEGFEEVDADFLEKIYQREHHIPWTILETERCIIRELALEDMDEFFALYDNEELCRYIEALYPFEEEKAFQHAYIENMYRFFGYGMWLVFLKENGELIGRAGLEHREYFEETELELGYLIAVKYQRQGYALEVCQAILEYATENTGFSRINALIDEENISSVRLAEKLGFSYAGSFDVDGKCMDRYILEFAKKVK